METEDDVDFDGLNDLDEDEPCFVPIKPRLRDLPRRNHAEVAETVSLESAVKTTYKPSRHEEGWLQTSISAFYEQNLIRDVLYLVKGGKEANVYCCEAGSAAPAGVELLAAKVYRPRAFRNLRNDHVYREGRTVLTSEGRAVKNSDQRMMRALGKKTDFGAQVQHTSWLMHEYTTLERLSGAGAPVPLPLAASENAVLMGYVGSRTGAAPTLSEVGLEPGEADGLFRSVLKSIESMLCEGVIHGDLSAYNLLYWEGSIRIIDFPQVTDPQTNPHAYTLFTRDVTRVYEYFMRQGVSSSVDADVVAQGIWQRCIGDG
ncbi:MAG: RIO1 family regulatory kinase/ATPase [Armatimonadota bacterium]